MREIRMVGEEMVCGRGEGNECWDEGGRTDVVLFAKALAQGEGEGSLPRADGARGSQMSDRKPSQLDDHAPSNTDGEAALLKVAQAVVGHVALGVLAYGCHGGTQ